MVELNSLTPARKTGPPMIGLVVCRALRPSSPLVTEGEEGGGGKKCQYSDQRNVANSHLIFRLHLRWPVLVALFDPRLRLLC